MNRADRRRAKREKDKTYSSPNTVLRNAVTQAVIKKQARDEAILATTGPMLEAVYAAIIILMTEEYGFSRQQCIDLLQKLEDKTLYCLDNQDILQEAVKKTGIIIHFRDAIDRIEEDIT